MSAPGGLQSSCKQCVSEYDKKIYAHDSKKRRDYNYRKYNITANDFEAIALQQNYKCAICKQKQNKGENLYIDHDHSCCPDKASSCGKCIRGLLCHNCNFGLGYFKDDLVILAEAIGYLGKHR